MIVMHRALPSLELGTYGDSICFLASVVLIDLMIAVDSSNSDLDD